MINFIIIFHSDRDRHIEKYGQKERVYKEMIQAKDNSIIGLTNQVEYNPGNMFLVSFILFFVFIFEMLIDKFITTMKNMFIWLSRWYQEMARSVGKYTNVVRLECTTMLFAGIFSIIELLVHIE